MILWKSLIWTFIVTSLKQLWTFFLILRSCKVLTHLASTMSSDLFNLKVIFFHTLKSEQKLWFIPQTDWRPACSFISQTDWRPTSSFSWEKKKHTSEAEWQTPTQHLATHFAYSLQEKRQLRAAETGGFMQSLDGVSQQRPLWVTTEIYLMPPCSWSPNKPEDVGQSEPNRRQGAEIYFCVWWKEVGLDSRKALFYFWNPLCASEAWRRKIWCGVKQKGEIYWVTISGGIGKSDGTNKLYFGGKWHHDVLGEEWFKISDGLRTHNITTHPCPTLKKKNHQNLYVLTQLTRLR